MHPRYSDPRMEEVWSDRFKWMTAIDLMRRVAEVSRFKTAKPLSDLSKGLEDDHHWDGFAKDMAEKELETRHDVEAFLRTVTQWVGEPELNHLFHYGLTSSDIVDSVLGVQMSKAMGLVLTELSELIYAMDIQIDQNHEVSCMGRTHGQYAEATTFAWKLHAHHQALCRSYRRILEACTDIRVIKLSGPIGTHRTLGSQHVERAVASSYEGHVWGVETGPTQVIQRDRHAAMISAMALMASCVENLATEIRHLAHADVAEVSEGKSQGQTGSSSMPHKSNPIKSENVCGLARLVRAAVIPAMENVTLWHERDISHSSVERHIMPDVFGLSLSMVKSMTSVIRNLEIDSIRMYRRLHDNKKSISTGPLLTKLQSMGIPREDAHRMVAEIWGHKEEDARFGLTLLNEKLEPFNVVLSQRSWDELISIDPRDLSHAVLGRRRQAEYWPKNKR